MNSLDHIVSRFSLYKGNYCLFAGAGISVCSGVPLASRDLPHLPSIVSNIREDYYHSLGNPRLSKAKLLSWYADQKLLQNPDTVYSDALNLIGDTPTSRERYLRKFFDRKRPGTCHISIAKLVEMNFLSIILTTNFDGLIEGGIRRNRHCLEPKVAAHSEAVKDISLNEKGPRVIKLHGDYLFSDIRNTGTETRTLKKNMKDKLRHCLRENGLLTIGYSGNDFSILSAFEEMAYDGGFFPFGLYWLHQANHIPGDRVQKFLKQAGGRLDFVVLLQWRLAAMRPIRSMISSSFQR